MRDERTFGSKLKPFAAVETDRGVGLTCPRRGCGGKFIVNLPELRRVKAERNIVTAPCPYCSAVSRLPEL